MGVLGREFWGGIPGAGVLGQGSWGSGPGAGVLGQGSWGRGPGAGDMGPKSWDIILTHFGVNHYFYCFHQLVTNGPTDGPTNQQTY